MAAILPFVLGILAADSVQVAAVTQPVTVSRHSHDVRLAEPKSTAVWQDSSTDLFVGRDCIDEGGRRLSVDDCKGVQFIKDVVPLLWGLLLSKAGNGWCRRCHNALSFLQVVVEQPACMCLHA